MSEMPSNLEASLAERLLRLTWADGVAELPFVFLRRNCGCAHCVDEWTGQRLLDPASVPDDIAIQKMDLVGSYAVRIQWSDGHSDGLYSWDMLRELARRLQS
jgi:DUF971 family protein